LALSDEPSPPATPAAASGPSTAPWSASPATAPRRIEIHAEPSESRAVRGPRIDRTNPPIHPASPSSIPPTPQRRTEPTSPAATPAVATLGEIAGVRQSVGMASTNGNVALYRRLLTMFGDSQRDLRERVTSAFDAQDPQAVIRHVHTLSAAAAGLGMMPL